MTLPIAIVHVPPSAQVCPFTVVALFASAAFGIALAVTAMLGVVVAFVTVGANQLGHVPALMLVTVPDPPLPLPQVPNVVPEPVLTRH